MKKSLFIRSTALLVVAALTASSGAGASQISEIRMQRDVFLNSSFGSEALAFSGLSNQHPGADSGTPKAVRQLGRWVMNKKIAGSAYLALLLTLHFDWAQTAPWLAFGGWARPLVIRSFLTFLPVAVLFKNLQAIINSYRRLDKPSRPYVMRTAVLLTYVFFIDLFVHAADDLQNAGLPNFVANVLPIVSLYALYFLRAFNLFAEHKPGKALISRGQFLFLLALWSPIAIHWPARVFMLMHSLSSWLSQHDPTPWIPTFIAILIGVAVVAPLIDKLIDVAFLSWKEHQSKASARQALGMSRSKTFRFTLFHPQAIPYRWWIREIKRKFGNARYSLSSWVGVLASAVGIGPITPIQKSLRMWTFIYAFPAIFTLAALITFPALHYGHFFPGLAEFLVKNWASQILIFFLSITAYVGIRTSLHAQADVSKLNFSDDAWVPGRVTRRWHETLKITAYFSMTVLVFWILMIPVAWALFSERPLPPHWMTARLLTLDGLFLIFSVCFAILMNLGHSLPFNQDGSPIIPTSWLGRHPKIRTALIILTFMAGLGILRIGLPPKGSDDHPLLKGHAMTPPAAQWLPIAA